MLNHAVAFSQTSSYYKSNVVCSVGDTLLPDVTHSPEHITVTNTLHLLSSEHVVWLTMCNRTICTGRMLVAYLCGKYRAAILAVMASVTYGKVLLCSLSVHGSEYEE